MTETSAAAHLSPVLVLHEEIGDGARPDEQDTLAQVEQVSAALRSAGVEATPLSTGLDLSATLAAIRERTPGAVFNLVESLGGDGRLIHLVPALLATTGVPFTGAGAEAMFLSSHKLLAKRWMRLHDIPTPDHLGESDGSDGPWIVKSLWEHASLGLDDGCVVNGTEAARARMTASGERHGGEWFAERYVEGREFNVSVLEIDGRPEVLPLAEMTFVDYPAGKPRIVGYAAKWDENAREYHATQRRFPELAGGLRQALMAITRQCWSVFGLRGYARVDFRVDADDRPWVLEVNANPCIAHDAGFAATAAEAGIAHERFVQHILESAAQGTYTEG